MLRIVQTGAEIIINESKKNCFMCGWQGSKNLLSITLPSYDNKLLYTVELCIECCYELQDEIEAAIKTYKSNYYYDASL